ncbi:MAG: hypothetical protein KIT79_10335 [Deltaproteobacteria bacterium]|nr:hypothetical protein [Deltaproteobacteria bacterium]
MAAFVPEQYKPEDDTTHEPGPESNYNESMYFNFYDRREKTGGWFRIGNRVNEGYAEMTCTIYLPNGHVLFRFDRPKIATNRAYDASGMKFETITPWRHQRITFSGKLHRLTQPMEMVDPKKALSQSERIPAELVLDVKGWSPIQRSEREDTAAAKMDFYKEHYEQHCAVTGTLSFDGKTISLEGVGLRDHSWGPRYWQGPKWYRWYTIDFSPTFGGMITVICFPDGSVHRYGKFYRGETEAFTVTDFTAEEIWDDDGPEKIIKAFTLRAQTTAGPREITGKVLSMLPLRNRREGMVTRITEGMTEYRLGDEVGYGLAEYLDQMQ